MSTIFDPDDFINKAKQIEEAAKKRTMLILAIVVAFVIVIVFYNVSKVSKVENKLVAADKVKNQIITIQNNEDSAKNIINDFFKFQNNNDSSGIISLLSDTIYRYYYIVNPTSVNDIKSNKNFLVNRTGKYRIDPPIQISKDNDTLTATVFTPIIVADKIFKNTLHKIKFNSSLKIIYVRAFKIDDVK